MPQPKVSSGPSRSTTIISRDRSCRFIRMAKYNPAGPPPITFILLIPNIQIDLSNLRQLTNDRLQRFDERRERRVAFEGGRAPAHSIINFLKPRPRLQRFQELEPLRGAQQFDRQDGLY